MTASSIIFRFCPEFETGGETAKENFETSAVFFLFIPAWFTQLQPAEQLYDL